MWKTEGKIVSKPVFHSIKNFLQCVELLYSPLMFFTSGPVALIDQIERPSITVYTP